MRDSAKSGPPTKGGPPAERIRPGGPPGADDVQGAGAREFWDPRVQTKFWLEVMSQAMDAWMRSVAFLEFMQNGLQMAIDAKRLQDQRSTNSQNQPHVEVGTTIPDPHLKGDKEP